MHSTFTLVITAKARRRLRKEPGRHELAYNPQRSASDISLRGDRRLAPHEEPPLGAHLITPRFAYQHHGIYVGSGLVVHYSAFSKHWSCGPVEEVSLARFAGGHPIWVRPARAGAFEGPEAARRARTRLGENRYGFWSNNCEHLSDWCVNGEHRSLQVEQLLAPLWRVAGVFSDLIRLLDRSWM